MRQTALQMDAPPPQPAGTDPPGDDPPRRSLGDLAGQHAAVPPLRFTRKHRENMRAERRHPIIRVVVLATGALTCVIGVVLMPLPGPGWLITIAGLSLIARESSKVARLMDWCELRMWRALRWWFRRRGKLPPAGS